VEEYGFTEADIPELSHLIVDRGLYSLDREDPRSWAQINAAYALGELGTEEALKVLIETAVRYSDHLDLSDSIPEAMALVGPSALPLLAAAFRRHRRDFFKASAFESAIQKIGEASPESRQPAIDVLVELLAEYRRNPDEMNAYLIASLADLKAADAMTLIRQVYESDEVDDSIITLENVEIDFGLREDTRQRPEITGLREFLLGAANLDRRDEPAPAEPRPARMPKSDADKLR
jgi:HEAT repeat protein